MTEDWGPNSAELPVTMADCQALETCSYVMQSEG